ncbi:hypothetical protein ALC60_00706 [Trachymyrmex zeteki]|uniref:Uncharacterized protein n=1 Tax=Mycetomoellerius zeteki TaxID=64791 RepID=A0A151XJ41_9HYME|nr:hypothetical protein ALC60_00706 [Trachymyrmex zeteki]
MILLGTSRLSRHAISPPPRGAPSHFDRSIDDWPNDSVHKNSDFSRDRRPALNDLATC